jgi:hypothetical protein
MTGQQHFAVSPKLGFILICSYQDQFPFWATVTRANTIAGNA